MTASEIWALFGQSAAIGSGATALAFFLFRAFSEKWLDSKFAAKVEEIRHTHSQELARLKARIDSSLDATVRFQEKEFNILSEAWDLLNRCYGDTHTFVSPVQRSVKISEMSKPVREEYIDGLKISEAAKQEILTADDPDDRLYAALRNYRAERANESQIEFNNYIFKNEIFMNKDLFKALNEAGKISAQAIQREEFNLQYGKERGGESSWDMIKNKMYPLVENVGESIREKFFGSHIS